MRQQQQHYRNNTETVSLVSLRFRIAEDAITLELEDDLNAEETSSEDEDELPQEGRWLKDFWERDEGEEYWDEDEAENEEEHEQKGVDDDNDDNEDEDEDSNEDSNEQEGDDEDDDEDEDANEHADDHAHQGDEDRDEMKRTSALLLQGQKSWKLHKTYKIWSIVGEIQASSTAVANHHHLVSTFDFPRILFIMSFN